VHVAECLILLAVGFCRSREFVARMGGLGHGIALRCGVVERQGTLWLICCSRGVG
jgi:hypothetical protein